MPHGFSLATWNAAKAEATKILIAVARQKGGGTLSYSDLVAQMSTIPLEAHDQRLDSLLGEISSDEDAAGHGMLSVIVVHKDGDQKPGPGFFELAGDLGRDTSDRDRCWIAEFRKVSDYWSKH